MPIALEYDLEEVGSSLVFHVQFTVSVKVIGKSSCLLSRKLCDTPVYQVVGENDSPLQKKLILHFTNASIRFERFPSIISY